MIMTQNRMPVCTAKSRSSQFLCFVVGVNCVNIKQVSKIFTCDNIQYMDYGLLLDVTPCHFIDRYQYFGKILFFCQLCSRTQETDKQETVKLCFILRYYLQDMKSRILFSVEGLILLFLAVFFSYKHVLHVVCACENTVWRSHKCRGTACCGLLSVPHICGQ